MFGIFRNKKAKMDAYEKQIKELQQTAEQKHLDIKNSLINLNEATGDINIGIDFESLNQKNDEMLTLHKLKAAMENKVFEITKLMEIKKEEFNVMLSSIEDIVNKLMKE